MAVKIFTDSTADLRREDVEKYGINVIPLTVHFGDETYKDWYDLSSEEFFRKLKDSSVIPKTSQIPPEVFVKEFSKEIEKGNEIVSIHIASRASGTCQSAYIAAQTIGKGTIEIVDSHSLSFSIGLMVLKACKLAEKGMGAREIAEKIRKMADHMACYFVVDSLDYLKKGGRITSAEAFFGGLLNIKPFLKVSDGLVTPIDKIRGSKRVIPRFIEEMKKYDVDFGKTTVAVAHGGVPENCRLLAEAIENEFHPKEILKTEVGSVIGSHAGPGVFGMFFCTLPDED